MSCHFCFNAHVYAKEKHDDADYFDEGLNDSNDGFSGTIGHADKDFQLYFNSGMGRPCNLEACRWDTKSGWQSIARYFPKFCPECGRKLDEFVINERGSSFEKRRKS